MACCWPAESWGGCVMAIDRFKGAYLGRRHGDCPPPDGKPTRKKKPRKTKSAPSKWRKPLGKSLPCVTVFTASPVSTHPAESAPGELVPVTLAASDTAGGRRTESEASGTPAVTPPGTPTQAASSNSTRGIETHWPLFTHAPHRAYAGSAITRSDAIFYFDKVPYGRTHPGQHKTPAIRHLNGPHEAWDALALPDYPYVLGGLVGAPGGLE